MLGAVKDRNEVSPEVQRECRYLIMKALHLMRWSWKDILNSVQNCARRITSCCKTHRKAMLRLMVYCVWILKPSRKWDKKTQGVEIELLGENDSKYAKFIDTRRSG